MADTTAPRKRLPGAERRAVILETAGPLFAERGYEATRLDDVAAAIGVTKPLLYRHFDSKRALYLALLERHRDDLATFTATMTLDAPRDQQLRAVVEAWTAYVESHSYAWQMLFRDSGGGPDVQAFRLQVHDRARAVLAELVGDFAERPIPPRERMAVAEMLSMGMAALVLWWMESREVGREVVIEAMTRVWVGVLAPGPEPPGLTAEG